VAVRGERRPAGAPAVGVGVEERVGDVEPDRVPRLRECVDPLRPEGLRRETFLDRDRHPWPPVCGARQPRGAMVANFPAWNNPLLTAGWERGGGPGRVPARDVKRAPRPPGGAPPATAAPPRPAR